MSSILDPELHPSDPIDIWIIAADESEIDIDRAFTLSGHTRNIDKYYHRIIKVHGIIQHIRGRCELLIFSPKDKERAQERLHHSHSRPPFSIRRLTPEELAAIAALEADAKNWKELGGIRTFIQPAEDDLPDYPPHPSIPSKGAGQAPNIHEAISDMQSEGGPPSPPPFKEEGEGEGEG